MFSEELTIMDRNTLLYMIEQLQEEKTEIEGKITLISAEVTRLDAIIAARASRTTDVDKEVAQAIAEKDEAIAEMDQRIRELEAQIKKYQTV